MKFTKLRKIAIAAIAICGLTLAGHVTAKAAEKQTGPYDEITLKLHKMDNQEPKRTIENTGDELELEGMEHYDAAKQGAVTYSIYDVTELLNDEEVKDNDVSDQELFIEKRDSLINRITNGKSDPQELLDAQAKFVEENKMTPTMTQTLKDSSGILEFKNLPNKGFYLILETNAPVNHLTSISAPFIVSLPINDKEEVHLYAKNMVARNVDPEIHKVGIDPENPTSDKHIALGGVTFILIETESGKKLGELTTEDDGNIVFSGLTANKKYTLIEKDTGKHLWYDQNIFGKNPEDGKVSLTFTVDKNGKIIEKDMKPNEKYFKIEGDRIGVLNFLELGGAKFKKVDADNSEKPLAGAKFKVQKNVDGDKYWAVFKDNTFVEWVTEENAATELVSEKDGTFNFEGVPYKYDSRDGKNVTYSLIETQAPTGYALLKAPKVFTINSDNEINSQKDEIVIENSRYALPITGGMGIWLFLLIGGSLMGGAGYWYYRQRKQA